MRRAAEPVEQVDPFASALAQPHVDAPGKTQTSAKTPAAGAAKTQAAASDEIPDAAPAKAPPEPQAEGGRIPAAALAFASAALLLFIMGALFLLRSSPSTSSKGAVVPVCTTSMTQRLAADIVAAYAAKTGAPTSAFDLVGAHGSQLLCDVRFMALALKKADWTVGHDAIVAVVNPLNPLNRITEEQLRGIFAGTITNWSQLGGSPGPILRSSPTTRPMRLSCSIRRF